MKMPWRRRVERTCQVASNQERLDESRLRAAASAAVIHERAARVTNAAEVLETLNAAALDHAAWKA